MRRARSDAVARQDHAGRDADLEGGDVLGRQAFAGHEQPRLGCETGERTSGEGGEEEVGANRTAAGADENGGRVGRAVGWQLGDHEAGVEQPVAQTVGEREAVAEREERRVAVDQDGVVVGAHGVEHALMLGGVALADQHVADGGEDQRLPRCPHPNPLPSLTRRERGSNSLSRLRWERVRVRVS